MNIINIYRRLQNSFLAKSWQRFGNALYFWQILFSLKLFRVNSVCKKNLQFAGFCRVLAYFCQNLARLLPKMEA